MLGLSLGGVIIAALIIIGLLILVNVIVAAHSLGWILLIVGVVLFLFGGGYGRGRWYGRGGPAV